jgi:hypothetical protein
MPINIPGASSLIPAGCPRFEEDFEYSSGQTLGRWVSTTTLGGSESSTTPTANQGGTVQLQTGNNAASISTLSRALGQFIIPAAVFWQFNIGISLPVLSAPGDAFTLRLGLGDVANGDLGNGVYFEYTDSAAFGQWQLCTANGGVRTKTASGTFVTTGKASLKAYGFNNMQGIFSINGNLVGSQVANFPTGIALGMVLGIYNTSSTVVHNLIADYAALYYNISR